MGLTQIQITTETKEELKKLKISSRETYEEIIKRLIKKK